MAFWNPKISEGEGFKTKLQDKRGILVEFIWVAKEHERLYQSEHQAAPENGQSNCEES